MYKIDQSLDTLKSAIMNQEAVAGDPEGYWHIEGYFKRVLRIIFRSENDRLASLANSLIYTLDQLEQVPVRFSLPNEAPAVQEVDFQAYLAVAELLLNRMNNVKSESLLRKAHLLKLRYLSLRYRLEKINGGLDKASFQKHLFIELKESAKEWKEKQIIFLDRDLSKKDLLNLESVMQYSEFVELILSDMYLKNCFFLWALRDKISVDVFVEFPAVKNKIIMNGLNGRISRFGGKALKIQKKVLSEKCSIIKKIVTLPFEGKDISILDESQKVSFRGNYTLSIKEVFEVFSRKSVNVGNLEFLADGIVNWNVHKLGWWDAYEKNYHLIDIDRPGWWKQLPAFEILTTKEARLKYGKHLDGIYWNAAPTASRSSPTLNFENTHAYLEIAIPMSQGRYAIYDFGKFATELPGTVFEMLNIFCKNSYATVAYPDENVFYSHRQHGHHSFIMTPQQGMQMMDYIKEDIVLSRQKNFVYQIESDNCAKWAFEKLELTFGKGSIPNLFKMHLLNTEPEGIVANLFNLIKKFPACMQTRVLTILHLPFAPARGTWILENGDFVCKSLTRHDFWKTAEVYLPALLIQQKELGVFGSTIHPNKYDVNEIETGNEYLPEGIFVLNFPLINSKYFYNLKKITGMSESPPLLNFLTTPLISPHKQ